MIWSSYAFEEVRQILCAIYTRLSKEDEDKHQPESESIQNQKSLLTRYAIEHGWDIYSIFSDESIILGLSQEVLAPQGFPGLVLIFIGPRTGGPHRRMIAKCVELSPLPTRRAA